MLLPASEPTGMALGHGPEQEKSQVTKMDLDNDQATQMDAKKDMGQTQPWSTKDNLEKAGNLCKTSEA